MNPRFVSLPLAIAMIAAAPAPADFRPDLFFEGHTRGRGTVDTVASPPRPLAVESVGRLAPDSTLILDQAITLGGKRSARTFRIRRLPDGSWQGSLSDASGPVRVAVTGDTLTLAYPMKRSGMRMPQTLTLQPGGRVALNRATVTLLGIPVARVEERIEKVD